MLEVLENKDMDGCLLRGDDSQTHSVCENPRNEGEDFLPACASPGEPCCPRTTRMTYDELAMDFDSSNRPAVLIREPVATLTP
jgi:hypothetical protein